MCFTDIDGSKTVSISCGKATTTESLNSPDEEPWSSRRLEMKTSVSRHFVFGLLRRMKFNLLMTGGIVNFDAGQYQCFASNEWGTATSNSVFVRKSDLNSFKDEPPMTVSAQEGSPFSLRCQPPDGWPKPSVYWMMQNSNGALRSINSSRMTVDPEGTLWFSNVTREDTSDDFVYACSATSLFR